MTDTLVMLQMEHRSYWRLLDLLEQLVDTAEAGGEVDVQRIALILEYFSEYPDRCHHPKEDLVFRRLEAVSPENAERVGDLVQDHRRLTELTETTAAIARDLAVAAKMSHADDVARLREFCESYRAHIRAEEQHFLPASLEHLSRSDLDLIDFSMFDARDPIFDEDAEARFAALRRSILESEESAGESGTS